MPLFTLRAAHAVACPFRIFSLLLVMLALSQAAHAQLAPIPADAAANAADTADGDDIDGASASAAPPHPEIDEVIVTASPLRRTADELVQPIIVLGGEELDRLRRGTLGETLESQPGIASTDFGAGAGRPVIRGLAGPRVEMLENGMSAMDVSELSPDHAVTISPAQARQIEVIKGPATLLYGNSASGGVVNVDNGRLPLKRRDGLHSALDLSAGDNADERNASGEASFGRGAHQWHADAGWREADDYQIPGTAHVDDSGSHGELANSALRATSGALSYAHIADNDNAYGAALSRFESRYGLPVEDSAFIDMHQTRIDAQVLLFRPLAALESLKLRAAAADYAHTEFEAPGIAGTRFENREAQARLEAAHRPYAGLRGVLGAQARVRDFSADGEEAYVPPVLSREFGVFLVEERALAYGSLEFGARLERTTNAPKGGAAHRDFTPLSLALGSRFDLGEDAHFKLYITHAERAPVPEELYAYGPHAATATFERGQLDADMEVANNIELGFDHHAGPWTFDARVYYNRISDYLYLAEVDAGLDADGSGVAATDGIADRVDEDGVFAADGELLLVDYRQTNARLYGFEAEARYALPLPGPVQVYARGFADRVIAERSNGEALPRIPPLRYGLGLDAHYRALGASLDLTRVARRDDLAPLEAPSAAYRLLNAELDYRLLAVDDERGSASIYLRGRNLLDDDIRRATSFIKDAAPAPGRALFIGLRWQL